MEPLWKHDFPDVVDDISRGSSKFWLTIAAWIFLVLLLASLPTMYLKLTSLALSPAFIDYGRAERQQLLQRDTDRSRLRRVGKRLAWAAIWVSVGYIAATMIRGVA